MMLLGSALGPLPPATPTTHSKGPASAPTPLLPPPEVSALPPPRVTHLGPTILRPGDAGAVTPSVGLAHPPQVADTLVLANDSLIPGNYLAQNPIYPIALAYDSAKGEVFVADYTSETVSVISSVTNTTVGLIHVGSSPRAVVYDSAKGEIFVANFGSSSVSVISDASGSVTATVSVGPYPDALAYDPATGEIFVASLLDDYCGVGGVVSVISDATLRVVGTIGVGYCPQGMTFDSSTGQVFVTNSVSYNVSVISAATDSVVASVAFPPGSLPYGVAYVGAAGRVFVADEGSANVSVISDSTDDIVATLGVGQLPIGVAYDPVTEEVYVANALSNNVSVISVAKDAVLANIGVGLEPYDVAYVGNRGELWVANALAGTVSLIADSTDAVTGTITLGSEPDQMVYDSGTGQLFVADYLSNRVWIVSDATGRVVTTIDLGEGTTSGMAYDSRTGEIFVADWHLCLPSECLPGTVSVISDRTDQVVASVKVGLYPGGIAFDSEKGEVFVANEGSGNVSVISDATNQVVASIPLGGEPTGVAYDGMDGEVFVTNSASGSVSVISDSTDRVVANLTVGGIPEAIVYDGGAQDVFVANDYSVPAFVVSVISTVTDRLVATPVVGGYPGGLAYDGEAGEIFVANSASDNVSVISDQTDRVIATVAVAADPVGGAYASESDSTYISNLEQGTLTRISPGEGSQPAYPVTFTESGLPGGTTWSVAVNGTPQRSTTSTIEFREPNGTYTYSIGAIAGYSATYHGQVTVNGAPTSEAIAFTRVAYAVTFTESGLPSGTNWSVTVNGTTHSSLSGSIGFMEPNGTYAYSIADVPGWHQRNLPYSGSVTVSGAPVSEPILVFTQVTNPVTFSETGLPSGTSWSVTLNGVLQSSTTDTLTFPEPNGSYSYGIADVPGWHQTTLPYSGTVTVDGASVSEPILVFTQVTYPVTFPETGLPSGTSWSVTLNGVLQSSTTDTLTFPEPNGSYSYGIVDVPGWHQTTLPYSGSLTVNGTSVSEPTLVFTQVTYPVTFTESGLAAGTSWQVNISGGAAHGSTTATISFAEPNGSYALTLWTAANYTATFSPFTLTINGTANGASVVFVRTYGVTFDRPAGTPTGASWTVYLNGTSPSVIPPGTALDSGGIERTTAASTLMIMAPNGSYEYSIVVGGNPSLTNQGTVNVHGSNVVANPPPSPTTFLGFSGLTGYYILGAIVTVVIVVAVWVMVLRGRGGKRGA